jgi:hypothetical protein
MLFCVGSKEERGAERNQRKKVFSSLFLRSRVERAKRIEVDGRTRTERAETFVFRNCFYVRYNHIEWVCLCTFSYHTTRALSRVASLLRSLLAHRREKRFCRANAEIKAKVEGSPCLFLSDDKLHDEVSSSSHPPSARILHVLMMTNKQSSESYKL